MAYTYTERKRIRKNFGTRDSVLEIPYLRRIALLDGKTAAMRVMLLIKRKICQPKILY